MAAAGYTTYEGQVGKSVSEYALEDFVNACKQVGGKAAIAPDRQGCELEHRLMVDEKGRLVNSFVEMSLYPKTGRMWIRFGQRTLDERDGRTLSGTLDLKGVRAIEALTNSLWLYTDSGNVTVTKDAKVHVDV
jgi:hypothetical protein